ncbi:MAG: response regulator [Alphaproteobacteria bacterium]|nr:response regulator [Alphaproteobacteria bacterium]
MAELDKIIAPRLDKVNVLIAEDDKITLKLLRDVLLHLGFKDIEIVEDGSAAIDVMRRKEIDLVICDWKMRPMDGLEFVKFIRNSSDSPDRFVPIIMLTGRAEVAAVMEARDVGVTEYLIKPFSVKALCERIIEVVENPRDFVIASSYKGPDRRRKESQPPDGQEKRKNRGTKPVKQAYSDKPVASPPVAPPVQDPLAEWLSDNDKKR